MLETIVMIFTVFNMNGGVDTTVIPMDSMRLCEQAKAQLLADHKEAIKPIIAANRMIVSASCIVQTQVKVK